MISQATGSHSGLDLSAPEEKQYPRLFFGYNGAKSLLRQHIYNKSKITMDTLHLKSFEWMLVPVNEFNYLMKGITDISVGYLEAASAQSTYYLPGTTTDATRVRSLLMSLKIDMPTVDQVKPLVPQINAGLGLYKFESNGDIWHIRNRSIPDWDRPFDKTRWVFYANTPEGWRSIYQVSSVKDALAFFPYVNGEHSKEQVHELLQGNEEGKSLLQNLINSELIETKKKTQWSYEEIPDFFFLGHSGLMVRSGQDLLAIDPVVWPTTRSLSHSEMPIDAVLANANTILISHCHWDHFFYQSLVRLPRDIKIIVPKQSYPVSFANPPMRSYLQHLGFTNVEERSPWEVVEVGDITLTLANFFGEPFGLDSQFDGLTYHVRFGDKTLYGSVDACYDEETDMEETIDKVAELGPLDYYLFCSSGLHHTPPFYAANLRHYSNELIQRPELIRFHPTHSEPTDWARRLKPKVLIPYAEFLFQGERAPPVTMKSVLEQNSPGLDGIPATHAEWGAGLHTMAGELKLPIQLLHPMQGLLSQE